MCLPRSDLSRCVRPRINSLDIAAVVSSKAEAQQLFQTHSFTVWNLTPDVFIVCFVSTVPVVPLHIFIFFFKFPFPLCLCLIATAWEEAQVGTGPGFYTSC